MNAGELRVSEQRLLAAIEEESIALLDLVLRLLLGLPRTLALPGRARLPRALRWFDRKGSRARGFSWVLRRGDPSAMSGPRGLSIRARSSR